MQLISLQYMILWLSPGSRIYFARDEDRLLIRSFAITSVNPSKFKLLFARFMSDARDEPPDIDVDFEHERREEVIQYIYDKYGRDRAAIVATVTQEQQKGALRDVGKAMGLSVDTLKLLSGSLWEFTEEWFEGKLVTEQGLNPADPQLR